MFRQMYLFRGRLAQFKETADRGEVWDERLSSIDIEKQFRWARKGALGVYQRGFLKYLPKDGWIIEAGCGTGRYVLALARLGYQVLGLDWATRTLQKAKHVWSEAPLIAADIECLPLVSASAAALISLGVIEHDLDPWSLLRDSVRVLSPGGILYLVVPYVNRLRRWKAKHGKYPPRDDNTDFYQYILADDDIKNSLSQCGCSVVAHFPTNAYSGLVDEYPIIDRWVRKLPFAHRLINALNRARWLAQFTGHVVHYVAVKHAYIENTD